MREVFVCECHCLTSDNFAKCLKHTHNYRNKDIFGRNKREKAKHTYMHRLVTGYFIIAIDSNTHMHTHVVFNLAATCSVCERDWKRRSERERGAFRKKLHYLCVYSKSHLLNYKRFIARDPSDLNFICLLCYNSETSLDQAIERACCFFGIFFCMIFFLHVDKFRFPAMLCIPL